MIIETVFAFVAGIALGWFFVGGLWMTIQKMPTAKSPALLSMSSLMLRFTVSLIGFYLVGRGSWQRLVAALIGFVVAKFLLVSRLGLEEVEEEKKRRERARRDSPQAHAREVPDEAKS